jgi:hypothetical protein
MPDYLHLKIYQILHSIGNVLLFGQIKQRHLANMKNNIGQKSKISFPCQVFQAELNVCKTKLQAGVTKLLKNSSPTFKYLTAENLDTC